MRYRARLTQDTYVVADAQDSRVTVYVAGDDCRLKFWRGTVYPVYRKHIYASYWFFLRKPEKVFRKQIRITIKRAIVLAQKFIQEQDLGDSRRFSNSTLAREMLCEQFRRADIEALP